MLKNNVVAVVKDDNLELLQLYLTEFEISWNADKILDIANKSNSQKIFDFIILNIADFELILKLDDIDVFKTWKNNKIMYEYYYFRKALESGAKEIAIELFISIKQYLNDYDFLGIVDNTGYFIELSNIDLIINHKMELLRKLYLDDLKRRLSINLAQIAFRHSVIVDDCTFPYDFNELEYAEHIETFETSQNLDYLLFKAVHALNDNKQPSSTFNEADILEIDFY
jgi:hypothetical protein